METSTPVDSPGRGSANGRRLSRQRKDQGDAAVCRWAALPWGRWIRQSVPARRAPTDARPQRDRNHRPVSADTTRIGADRHGGACASRPLFRAHCRPVTCSLVPRCRGKGRATRGGGVPPPFRVPVPMSSARPISLHHGGRWLAPPARAEARRAIAIGLPRTSRGRTPGLPPPCDRVAHPGDLLWRGPDAPRKIACERTVKKRQRGPSRP